MIDLVGTPASILALVNIAFAATVALHQAFKDINNYPSDMIEHSGTWRSAKGSPLPPDGV